MSQQLKLERIHGDVWLATWQLEEPVWAVVQGHHSPSMMMLVVTQHAHEIPWRSGVPARPEVEEAVKALPS